MEPLDQTIPENRNIIRDRIVNGHIGRTVWWLAWPSAITMLLQTANGLVDAVFVGRLGSSALAGVGLASQIMLILMSISAAVSIGATALVARFIGSNEPEDAAIAVRQSVLISIVLSVISGVVIYLLGPTILHAIGGRGEGLRLGVSYLNILLLGVTPFFLMFVLSGVFRGLGDVKTPLNIMIVITVISLVGDYLLIFGIGPFPRMGVVGAGIATVASRIAATLLYLYYIPKSHLRNALHGSWCPHWDWFRRIMNIASPAAVQGLLRTGASMLFFSILGLTPEGMVGIAALTIGLRTEALAFMPGFAFSIAATSMVGQNLGASQPDRAEKSAWAAVWQGIWVTSAIGLLFIVFARPIASLFTNDPDVLPLAAQYLMLNGISEPFLAMAMVFTGALQGAGETRLPMYATILTLWVIRLPFTYILAITLGLDAYGAWIAMSASTVLQGLATLWVFKVSRWTETTI
ncbi:MAG: MATE family efflux transporter [Armatimonadota bacterium]